MTPFLQLALALAILVSAAKVGGYLSYRLGQPSVLGELLVGVLLGPSLVDVLHLAYFSDRHLPEVIQEFAELGVLLLMFLAGLELDLKELTRSHQVATLAGLFGVLLPVLLGTGAGLIFHMGLARSFFIGLILAATSVSISAQTLMELDALRTRVGLSLLGAAVLDDILVVLGLSLFSALVLADSPVNLASLGLMGVRMALFLLLAGGLGWLLLPLAARQVTGLPISQGLTAFTVVMVLLYGWAAEELGGMAAITGAFLVGLLFARSTVRERIESSLSALAYGLFVPIFFIDIGLNTDLRQLGAESLWLFLVLALVAAVGKIMGCGFGGWLGGLNRWQALQLGIGMLSRGEVGLIVASFGMQQGIIDDRLFSSVVGVIVLTTLLTPPLLRTTIRYGRQTPAIVSPPQEVVKEESGRTGGLSG